MDSTHVSEKIWIRFEGNETVLFSSDSAFPSRLPTKKQLRKKVTGIQLSYEFCSEQKSGIVPLKKAFGAESSCIIQKIPNELSLDIQKDVIVLKYGTTHLSPRLISIAKAIGMSGYWDDSNLIICTSTEYSPIMFSIIDFMQPQKAVFAFKAISGGQNLMIIS